MRHSGKLTAFATTFALMAVLITHMDDLPPTSYTPFLNLMENHTDCGPVLDADDVDCTQTIRQTRSLVSAMAAAIFTIISANATGRWRVGCVVAAGVLALKAVFNQMMYISDGDPMLPIAIVVVSALCTFSAAGIWLSVHQGGQIKKIDAMSANRGHSIAGHPKGTNVAEQAC